MEFSDVYAPPRRATLQNVVPPIRVKYPSEFLSAVSDGVFASVA